MSKFIAGNLSIKLIYFSLGLLCLLLVPTVVLASEEVLTINPYGALATLFVGAGGVLAGFVRRRFKEFKRIFDVIVALLALIIGAPFLLLMGILIKIFSPNGPIVYVQERVGEGGRLYFIYKLRTMRPNAEGETGAVWSAGDQDHRVIPRIGSFLRKTHMDEFPQFFNVLKGEMSVVGPRPERPEIVNRLKKDIPEYDRRLRVKPGITGLAQIRHHYDHTLDDVRKKVKLDLLYIRRMCFFAEMNILLRTVWVVLKGHAV